jgi:hypothetical protein
MEEKALELYYVLESSKEKLQCHGRYIILKEP